MEVNACGGGPTDFNKCTSLSLSLCHSVGLESRKVAHLPPPRSQLPAHLAGDFRGHLMRCLSGGPQPPPQPVGPPPWEAAPELDRAHAPRRAIRNGSYVRAHELNFDRFDAFCASVQYSVRNEKRKVLSYAKPYRPCLHELGLTLA